MPLVFAAVTPHYPALLPEIGKEHLDKLKKTTAAFKHLEEIMYSSGVETLLVISPHGELHQKAFSINLNREYRSDFTEFGNFSLTKKFYGDIKLINAIKDTVPEKTLVAITSDEKIDHGTAVPLHLLATKLQNIKIVPLSCADSTNEDHWKLGEYLKDSIYKSEERIGIIASADLSHSLSKNAPAGYSPKAQKFDDTVIAALEQREFKNLLLLDSNATDAAAECGLRALLILAGVINKVNIRPQKLSYEAPFGVGFLVMNFDLA